METLLLLLNSSRFLLAYCWVQMRSSEGFTRRPR